jgi:hypothetical protein
VGGTPTRLTTKVTGYYQVKVLAETNRKVEKILYSNSKERMEATTLETTTIGASRYSLS